MQNIISVSAAKGNCISIAAAAIPETRPSPVTLAVKSLPGILKGREALIHYKTITNSLLEIYRQAPLNPIGVSFIGRGLAVTAAWEYFKDHLKDLKDPDPEND